jgi:hypothetical protein
MGQAPASKQQLTLCQTVSCRSCHGRSPVQILYASTANGEVDTLAINRVSGRLTAQVVSSVRVPCDPFSTGTTNTGGTVRTLDHMAVQCASKACMAAISDVL